MKPPSRIYLQWRDENGKVPDDLDDLEGITWCAERINATDLVYFRAGKKFQHTGDIVGGTTIEPVFVPPIESIGGTTDAGDGFPP